MCKYIHRNRYPYFKYMDKSSLTSWRVSLKVFKITAVVVVSHLVVPFVSQLNAI